MISRTHRPGSADVHRKVPRSNGRSGRPAKKDAPADESLPVLLRAITAEAQKLARLEVARVGLRVRRAVHDSILFVVCGAVALAFAIVTCVHFVAGWNQGVAVLLHAPPWLGELVGSSVLLAFLGLGLGLDRARRRRGRRRELAERFEGGTNDEP